MNKIFEFIDISKIDRISFRGDINGLRAIAVLAVVLYHADIGPFKGGWLGVDIFFVISGYLITSIILKELFVTNTISFKRFFERRSERKGQSFLISAYTASFEGDHERALLELKRSKKYLKSKSLPNL